MDMSKDLGFSASTKIMFEDKIEKSAIFIAGLTVAAFIVATLIITFGRPHPTQILSSDHGQYVKVCVSDKTGVLRVAILCKASEKEIKLVRHFPDSSQ